MYWEKQGLYIMKNIQKLFLLPLFMPSIIHGGMGLSKYLCQDFSGAHQMCKGPFELASVSTVTPQNLKEQFNKAFDLTQVEQDKLPSLNPEADVSTLSTEEFIVRVFSEMKHAGMIPSILPQHESNLESKKRDDFLRIASSIRPTGLLPVRLLTPEELIALGHRGNKMAQSRVLEGYQHGYFGFKQSKEKQEKLLNKGWGKAFPYTAEDLRVNRALKIPDDQLMSLAERGSQNAQFLVANGYAEGTHGFQQSPEELMKLVYKHWEGADWFVVWGLIQGKYGFQHSTEKMIDLAEEGFGCFQSYVASGYATGHYGFTQSTEKLLELANKGWKSAKSIVASGYAENRYGLQVSPDALVKLADEGVEDAQKYLVKNLKWQKDGFAENPILYGLFKAYYKVNEEL